MGGAYVAKPDAVPPVPSCPVDWDSDWEYPGDWGVYPPGYEPEFSLDLTAPSSTSVGSMVAVSVTLFDHESYETAEPPDESVLTWSATVDGEARLVRFEGVGDYAASVSQDYSEVDSFWLGVASLDVQLTDDDAGKTLVVRVASTLNEEEVIGTGEVEVGGGFTFSGTYTLSGLVANVGFSLFSSGVSEIFGVANDSPLGGPSVLNIIPDTLSMEIGSGIVTMDLSEFNPEVIYWVCFSFEVTGDGSVMAAGTLTINGEEYSFSKDSSSGSGAMVPWLSINGATGEVTEVNNWLVAIP